MAETIKAGLSSDPSKVNPTGASQEDLGEYQKSLEEQIKALEQRYENPNWFKVAAGFLKPQLGGFAASLGSASEALGENIEQQRAAALPIAQMRSQLAQSKILTGQKKSQSDEFEAWRASGKPMDQATFSRIFSLDPSSQVAEAAKAAYEGQRKDLEYTTAQQRLMMDAIQMKLAKGQSLTPAEQKFMSELPSQLSKRQEAQPLLPGGEPTGAAGPDPVAGRLQRDFESINRELSRLPAGDSRRQIIENELQQVKEAAAQKGIALESASSQQAKPSQQEDKTEQGFDPSKFTPYTPTFTYPSVAGLSDDHRRNVEESFKENARAEESQSRAIVNGYRTLAESANYTAVRSEYDAAINLLQKHPEVAAKVFNVMRGDGKFLNQVGAAAQAGFGLNFNNMSANLSVPVEPFKRAGFSPEEQMLADRLAKAMLVVGNAKLVSQGITPDKGQEAYNRILDTTKASLSQRPTTALLNLLKDREQLEQNKKLYDQITAEFPMQQRAATFTPYTDILRSSPYIQRINREAKSNMEKYDAHYSSMIGSPKKP